MANKVFRGSVHRTTPEQVEALAASTAKGGHIVVLDATGKLAFGAANFAGIVYVCKEPILEPLATYTYALNDTLFAYKPKSGELYQARIAVGQTLVKDAPLALAANGQLTAAGANPVVAYLDQDVTASTADQLVDIKFQ